MRDKTLAVVANATIGIGAISAGVILGIMPNGGFGALFPTKAPVDPNATSAATGDAIDYEFGTVQLNVTKKATELISIEFVQAGANGGREQAFPQLQQAALAANGTNFGNISGATYTTDAFKAALDSALAKLP